jgi:hypothetical protein
MVRFRYRKSANSCSVPVRKSQIRKLLWITPQICFLLNIAQQSHKIILKVVFVTFFIYKFQFEHYVLFFVVRKSMCLRTSGIKKDWGGGHEREISNAGR